MSDSLAICPTVWLCVWKIYISVNVCMYVCQSVFSHTVIANNYLFSVLSHPCKYCIHFVSICSISSHIVYIVHSYVRTYVNTLHISKYGEVYSLLLSFWKGHTGVPGSPGPEGHKGLQVWITSVGFEWFFVSKTVFYAFRVLLVDMAFKAPREILDHQ